ncbi:MAG: ABC transporter substrate-binding protein [Intestinimonas sp.]|nr:ABC transporter substrate-binding protein [Intestinimonas sp.]
MRRTGKLVSLLLSGSLLLTLLAGCGGGTSGAASSDNGSSANADDSTFTVALDSDIVKLDPAFAYDFTTNPVVNQITQGLLTFDTDNKLQPMLAKSWKQMDDLTYVYEIRDDVTFSDGSPMTMDDVLYSLNRTRDPDVASYLGWMFDSVDTIEQTGDWELTVKLKTPDATWQYFPATTACHIISKKFAESAGDKLGTPEGGIMGTGPYKFVSWKNGTEVDLTRNENYWNTDDKPYYDNLAFKIITEDTTRVTALQTGDVDCVPEPPSDMLDVLKSDSNVTLTASKGFGVTFLAFNNAKAPFNDVRVRKAIYHAINFQSIQDNLVKDTGTTGTTLPSSDALFTIEPDRWAQYAASVPTYDYDVDEAKQLLAQAGYADGFDATLCISQKSLHNSIALAIQNDLAQVGINLTINKVSTDEHTAYQFGDVLDDNGLRDYDMILAGWEADFPDPSGNLTPLFQGGNTSNSAAYENSQVDEYISQQMQSSDPTERNDLMFKAFDIITDEVPYIFVYYPIKNIAMNKNYTGVVMNASWIWNIHFQDVHPAE